MFNMTIEHRVVNEYFETTGAEILTVETFILLSFPHQQHSLPTTGDWLILARMSTIQNLKLTIRKPGDSHTGNFSQLGLFALTDEEFVSLYLPCLPQTKLHGTFSVV